MKKLTSSKRLYPENIFVSPGLAIKRMIGLRQKHGDTKALTDGKFKREREMWIAGVFLLAMARITRKEYWLRTVEEAPTPDIITINLSPTANGSLAEFQNVEIFEYESHFQGDMVDAIRSKLSKKSYPDNYALLCYFHGRTGEVLKPHEISNEISKLSPKLSQIWIMGSIRSENPHTYTVTQLFPERIYHNFDYKAALNETSQKELIRARRDLTKKTLSVDFEDLGKVLLPLP